MMILSCARGTGKEQTKDVNSAAT